MAAAAGNKKPSPMAQRMAKDIAAGKQLVVLIDGPWAGHWYWRHDLEAQQAAARYMHDRGGTAELSTIARYAPTTRTVPHREPGFTGTAYEYRPTDVTRRQDTAHVPAPRTAGDDLSQVS